MTNDPHVSYEDWEEIGILYYGKDKGTWAFTCPTCNRSFTLKMILEKNPQVLTQHKMKDQKELLNHLLSRCGWYFIDKSCNWSLNGLFHSENVFVLSNGSPHRVFYFTDPDANADLRDQDQSASRLAKIQEITAKCQVKTWQEFQWDDWIPKHIREQVEDFWSASYGRDPQQWLKDFRDSEPLYGEVVTTMTLSDKKQVTGRYVHKCNNIGFVVMDDGTYDYVSS